MKLKYFKPIKNISIPYFVTNKTFEPNLTSQLIVKSIYMNKKKFKKKNILDLGCGTGIIGIFIKKKILKNSNIFFSDISHNAIDLTMKNCKLNKLPCEIKISNLLNNWENQKFDLIINDVSAISSFFQEKKIWYNNYIPSDTGIDGTRQTLKFLKNIKNTNNNNIIMPLISLCDTKKIKKKIKNCGFKFTSLINQDWPLPKKLSIKEKKKLLRLNKEGNINIKEIYGILIANTEVLYLQRKYKS